MSRFVQYLNEKLIKIGTCVEVGRNRSLPWDNATDMSYDLGYYARFDDWDYGPAEESDWKEITKSEFTKIANASLPHNKFNFIIPKNNKRKLAIAYDEKKDIHHIYA